MSNIGKIIRVNALPPEGERETNVIYQVAAPGAATYTDYAIDENGDMKNPATGLSTEDLKDNIIKISDPDLQAEGIFTQAQFNKSTLTDLDHKLNAPVTDGNTQNFSKVVGIDGNGNTAKLPAGDLGKNMMNTDLSSTSARNHTVNAPFTINTLGNPYTVSGLPNKNTDIGNFQKIVVQNTSGLNAVVDSKSFLVDMPNQMTEAEKTAWKTKMNGGWTTASMSVGLISPTVVNVNNNNNTWILLKGANLNINPTSFSVEIMANDGNTPIALVPNSQVQLSANGTDLIFYFNFHVLPIGSYKIKIWNGVANYVTGKTVTVTNNMQMVNTGALTWDLKTFNNNASTENFGSGGSAQVSTDSSIEALANNYNMIASLKSSELIPANKDFYLQFQIENIANSNASPDVSGGSIYAGLTLSSNSNQLISNSFAFMRFHNFSRWQASNGDHGPAMQIYQRASLLSGVNFPSFSTTGSKSYDFILQRVGSLYTFIVIDNSSNALYTQTFDGSTDALSLSLQIQNRLKLHKCSINIINCYLTN
ncbi:hypothetical protein [Chryseobacterium sp. JM1]|uniref:hypothetical protein n=1 Tax=Chryseobacterium sp. JM1 TaxID=1233950 RepID=UPI0004E6EAEB|nr:hypothetical protein [Chryseobacterium sp. JM1]KFF22253.1 hypothetical protein IW22_03450 [Chryseobacterium sp. JM1]